MLGVQGVQTSTIGYGDSYRKTYFASSEGAYIEQERIDVNMRLAAIARDGGDVQQSGISVGSLGDFSFRPFPGRRRRRRWRIERSTCSKRPK